MRLLIIRDVHYVHNNGFNGDVEYPDGYEIQGKWQVREEAVGGGSSEYIDCCLSLAAARNFKRSDDTVEVDDKHYAMSFAEARKL